MAVATHKELVGIEFENLFFGIMIFETKGEEQFLELCLQGPICPLKEILGGLLGEAASTLNNFAGLEISKSSPKNPYNIDAYMRKEPVILGSDQGIDKGLRDLIIGYILTMGTVEKGPDLGHSIAKEDIALFAENFFDVFNMYFVSGMRDNKPIVGSGKTESTTDGYNERKIKEFF
jgi:hypothetical protein